MLRLSFTLNGIDRTVEVEARSTLVEVLRETFFLTGTKEACGVGECGSCMVLIDGEATPSCLVLIPDVAGRTVETIEGLASDGVLDAVQTAFVEAGAFQCGFCTPGMVVAAEALLRHSPGAAPDEITQALSGVLCRCGSYPRVLEAFGNLTGRGAT